MTCLQLQLPLCQTQASYCGCQVLHLCWFWLGVCLKQPLCLRSHNAQSAPVELLGVCCALWLLPLLLQRKNDHLLVVAAAVVRRVALLVQCQHAAAPGQEQLHGLLCCCSCREHCCPDCCLLLQSCLVVLPHSWVRVAGCPEEICCLAVPCCPWLEPAAPASCKQCCKSGCVQQTAGQEGSTNVHVSAVRMTHLQGDQHAARCCDRCCVQRRANLQTTTTTTTTGCWWMK